jgi:hypothetical protein
MTDNGNRMLDEGSPVATMHEPSRHVAEVVCPHCGEGLTVWSPDDPLPSYARHQCVGTPVIEAGFEP